MRSLTSQPKLLACWRRSGSMSPTMTTAAPSSCAEAAHASPTGPAPATYTVLPGFTPAVKAPWKPARMTSRLSVEPSASLRAFFFVLVSDSRTKLSRKVTIVSLNR
eukprot:23787-Prorocentrum_minimum.AAC.3